MDRAGKVDSFTVSAGDTCDEINQGLEARFVTSSAIITIFPVPHPTTPYPQLYRVFYRRADPMKVGLFGERFKKTDKGGR